MMDIATTMTRIDEILAEYVARRDELAKVDFTEEIERQVEIFREKLVAEATMKLAAQLRDVEISIMAVEKVKAKLLEESNDDATTE